MFQINFIYLILILVFTLVAGSALSYSKKTKKIGLALYILGGIAMITTITLYWISVDRPPMRTLGETRLWYATFSPFIGLATYLIYRYKWMLGYSAFISILFLGINASNPEVMSKTLMPALQSVWFVPHVLVYLFAYALLGTSAIIALRSLTWDKLKKEELIIVADNLVFTGFSFLTMGLLFGALWAKKAWGHYWTWDPKETWALITWILYLMYIHIRFLHPKKNSIAFYTLILSFCILIACWYGVNYMPSSADSVHTYTETD